MTTIYFVRHAEPNYNTHKTEERGLSEKGLADRRFVTKYLWDKNIDAVVSSPYKRAYDTVKDFADSKGMAIDIVDDFRERKIADIWIEDFKAYAAKQWSDFEYKLENGECLREVQERNIAALNSLLNKYSGQAVAIGTHGTSLSTIIDYYDNSFGYDGFELIRPLMPCIVKMVFDGTNYVSTEIINVFEC